MRVRQRFRVGTHICNPAPDLVDRRRGVVQNNHPVLEKALAEPFFVLLGRDDELVVGRAAANTVYREQVLDRLQELGDVGRELVPVRCCQGPFARNKF